MWAAETESVGVLSALCYGVNMQHKGSKVRDKAAAEQRGSDWCVYLSVLESWFQRTWRSGPGWRGRRREPSSATPHPPSSGRRHDEDPDAPSPRRSDGGQTYSVHILQRWWGEKFTLTPSVVTVLTLLFVLFVCLMSNFTSELFSTLYLFTV